MMVVALQELERGLEASSKSHTQELRGLRLKHKTLASETNTLREAANRLHNQLMVIECVCILCV